MTSTEQETETVEAPTDQASLTDDEMAMLELERSWWKYAAVKETLVRERFGISSTIYYLRLNALIDRPEALVADPMTVRRLQRLRAQRQAQRSGRRASVDA